VTDDELLDRLRTAFACEPPEGTPRSLDVLNLALMARGLRSDPLPRRRSPRRSPSRRRWAIPAISAAAVLGGSGVAFAASGTPLPEPVRRVAYATGLPVDSPDLAAARDARHELRSRLDAGDRAAIVKAAARLRTRLHALNPDEQGGIEHQTDDLLRRADTVTGVQQDQRGTADNPQHEQAPSTSEKQAPPAASDGNGVQSGNQPGAQSGTQPGSQRGNSAPATTTDSPQANEGP
jgi:hypothetical protein